MIQDPNPADYPHLEAFTDWLYEHVEELPSDVETLKKALRIGVQQISKNDLWRSRRQGKTASPVSRQTP